MIKTLRTFYGFLLSKRKLVFAVFLVLVVTSNILFSLNPVFYKQFIDQIPSLNYQALLKILAIYMLIRVSAVITDMLSYWIGDFIIFHSSIDARLNIFKKVQDLDFAFHAEKSTGSLISAFKRGDSAMFSFYHDIHHKILATVISFITMIYFFYQVNITIVLLTLATLITTLLASRFLIQNSVKKRSAFNKEEDNISGIITDNLINFETVKLFAKEKWEEKRMLGNFKPWLKALWGYGNSFRLIDATMGTIVNLSIFSILLFSINKTVNLKMSAGDFVLVTSFLSIFFPRLWEIIWGLRDIAKNYSDIEKYFELLDFDIEVKEPNSPSKIDSVKGNIKFINVSHSYKSGTKNAVKNLNLSIKQGESVAFVGRSGSGKTTITKLLMRFFDPTKGKIIIDGIDIKDFEKSKLRSFFGVVPQEAILFNNTIAYNIAYGSSTKVSMDKIKKAAKLANISDFIEKLPKKYQTNVGERGIKLSGGQKQRLAIARMIMSNPEIIIFDEATSHLDSESERLIQEAFWNYAKGKTTIVIAHRLSTISKADRIVVMDMGKVIEEGSHKDLLVKKQGKYKKLWDIQTGSLK